MVDKKTIAIAALVVVAAIGWGMYLKADSEIKSLEYVLDITDKELINMNIKYSELEGNNSQLEKEFEELLNETSYLENRVEKANPIIIAKRVILGKGHRFSLEIHLNNTGDLSAYNTTILANVNFTTKYRSATIYLQEDGGVLKDGSLRGSILISIIDPGITEHFISMDFLLGSRWVDNPIAYIVEPYGGYSFYILSDDIIIALPQDGE